MVLSILIIAWLLISISRGYQNGLIRTLVRFIGRIIIYVAAILLAHKMGSWLGTFFLDHMTAEWATNGVPEILSDKAGEFLASGIAFFIITTIGYWLLWSIEGGLRFLNNVPVLGTMNRLAGALLAGLMTYILIFFILQVTQTIAISWYRDQLLASPVAQWILNQTPYLSDAIYQWWVVQ